MLKNTDKNIEEEYRYHTVNFRPSEREIEDKKKEGWEFLENDMPKGPIGRELDKEPNYPHSVFYFRKKINNNK